jgi:hypothetical protein
MNNRRDAAGFGQQNWHTGSNCFASRIAEAFVRRRQDKKVGQIERCPLVQSAVRLNPPKND